MEATGTPSITEQYLLEAVEDALWGYEPYRMAPVKPQVVVHEGGAVALHGPVLTRRIAGQMERIVAAVPGVSEVRNELVPDTVLDERIAQALADDPRLQDLPPEAVQATSLYGAVRLTGKLPEAVSPDTVKDVVRSVAGVYDVEVEFD